MSLSTENVDIHEFFLRKFDDIYMAQYDERIRCRDDRRFNFIDGAQWETYYRQFENRPRFQVNKTRLSVLNILNEYRNNRITVDFVSKNGKGRNDLSNHLDNMYRSAENESNAVEAYDNAMDEAVTGGIGAWKLVNDCEDDMDEDNHRQVINIEPIYDADISVFFDTDSKRYDKKDSKYCYQIYSITKKRLKEEYDEDVATWPTRIQADSSYDWSYQDIVKLSEVYMREDSFKKIYIFQTIDGEEKKYYESDMDDKETLSKISSFGETFLREKRIKKSIIKKYLMSGNKILKDYGVIPGENIPIIMLYGQRAYIDNQERVMGHVRLAKDMQMLKNMQVSRLAEISSLSPVEKPIFTPEQLIGHEREWANSNVDNAAYLLINPIIDKSTKQTTITPPVGYSRVPNIPPALAALMQSTEVDIKDLLGDQEQGKKLMSNVSDKSIQLVQNKLDMQTYMYMSNMAKSIKRSGEIFLSMAKDIYVEDGRSIKGIDKEKNIVNININEPYFNDKNMDIEYKNDIKNADYEIISTVTASSSSKKESTIKNILEMIKVSNNPEMTNILSNFILMNMEGEGLEDIKKYVRKVLVNSGIIEPNEEEKELMVKESQNKKKSSESIYLESAAEKEQAEAAKKRSETALTISKTEETQVSSDKKRAETEKILSEIENNIT